MGCPRCSALRVGEAFDVRAMPDIDSEAVSADETANAPLVGQARSVLRSPSIEYARRSISKAEPGG